MSETVFGWVWFGQAVVFALWAYAIYQSKGWRGFGYGIIFNVIACLCLGPLVLIYAAYKQPYVPTHKACPFCNFVIPIGAVVCGHCGMALIQPGDAPTVVDVTPERQAR